MPTRGHPGGMARPLRTGEANPMLAPGPASSATAVHSLCTLPSIHIRAGTPCLLRGWGPGLCPCLPRPWGLAPAPTRSLRTAYLQQGHPDENAGHDGQVVSQPFLKLRHAALGVDDGLLVHLLGESTVVSPRPGLPPTTAHTEPHLLVSAVCRSRTAC